MSDYLHTLKTKTEQFKCPICKGQIDYANDFNICNFACVYNNDHYRVKLQAWDHDLYEFEIVNIDNKNYRYSVKQGLGSENYTSIRRYQIDGEKRVIENICSLPIFSCQYRIFDFSKVNQEQIINKLNITLIFE